MKKMLIIESVDYTLTEEAKKDKSLNPIDLNVLAELDDILGFDRKKDDDGYMPFLIASNNAEDTLQNMLFTDGCKADRRTIERSLKKLHFLGYISYKKGERPVGNNAGKYPKFKLLKGSSFAVVNNRVTDNNTEHCSVIAHGENKHTGQICENTFQDYASENDVTDNNTERCSVIAHGEIEHPETDKNDTLGSCCISDGCSVIAHNLLTYIDNAKVIERIVTEPKEKEKEKDKKDKEKENALKADLDQMSLSSSFEFSDDEATPSENITNANPKNESNMKQDETKTTITKDELDNAALFYAVLRRAGWRSGDDWKSDLSYFRRKCSEVHGKGEDWTNRYAQRLDTIANTKVKDMYDDDIAKRVIPDFKAKAFRNVDKLLAERIEQHRRFSEKDYEYFQRITVSLCDGLRDTLWNRMAIRLTRRCNMLPDD